jgi:hypothetical protein
MGVMWDVEGFHIVYRLLRLGIGRDSYMGTSRMVLDRLQGRPLESFLTIWVGVEAVRTWIEPT